ncbi:sortase [Leuconostoc citreum]|uniref:sortase family protein n=1 Tax=Leuconostoc citreum TaxID=33964 RepID=UPI00200A143E|nr:sortase [Leuconostoc citreum]MCK8605720.1 sortase [Leuconostoc citreum]
MGINKQQLKRNQVKRRHKKVIIVVAVTSLALGIIALCGVYGNHSQWQTAARVQKLQNKASKQKSAQPISNSKVDQMGKKEGIQPDYSGQGGLVAKDKLLQLAQSQQPEILRGYVAMPSYGISEPIYEGTSNHVLAIGVGVNQPNQVFGEGSVTLFGHNMGDYNAVWPYKPTKFSAMQNMRQKDVQGRSIFLSDGQTAFEYRVKQLDCGVPVSELEARLANDNQANPAILRLVACLEDEDYWHRVKASNYTDFRADKRIILTGELVSSKPINQLTQSLQKALQINH